MMISLRKRPVGALVTAAALALASLAGTAAWTATPASASGRAATDTALASASGDASSSPGNRASALTLPRPTGPYATGRDTLFLTDHGRADPWVPAA
ncbi:alpha/beta hydrolase, partial [Streptomyces sp. SID5466]|nr:alpha/beta hydrolase [Streptomyces sp. SID5466]